MSDPFSTCVGTRVIGFSVAAGDHGQGADDWRVNHVGHLLDKDPSLQVIGDLADGEQAERSAVEEAWRLGPLAD